MTPKLLKTFLAVERTGNMSAAATQLNLAQSSVSDQIQTLETQLGVTLFERSRGGLGVTPAGLTLKTHAETILATVDEATAALTRQSRTQRPAVTLGALETLASRWLPDRVLRFRADHPNIDVRLRVENTTELLRMVKAGEADAVFCFEARDLDPSLASRTVAKEPLSLIAGITEPAHRDAGFVATRKGCVFRRIFDENVALLDAGKAEIGTEVDSIATIIRLVDKGEGMALVPRMAARDALERGEIRELGGNRPDLAARVSLVWRRRRVQPDGLRQMLVSLDSHQAMSAVAM